MSALYSPHPLPTLYVMNREGTTGFVDPARWRPTDTAVLAEVGTEAFAEPRSEDEVIWGAIHLDAAKSTMVAAVRASGSAPLPAPPFGA